MQSGGNEARIGGSQRQKLGQYEFGLVLIYAPLPDGFGHELAAMVTETSLAGMRMVVKSELGDDVGARVGTMGV